MTHSDFRPSVAVALSSAVIAALTGCVTPETTGDSLWPPADFSIEVRVGAVEAGEIQDLMRFRVFADGLAVWREARDSVGGVEVGSAPFPVFRTVAAYRLSPQSLRMLSRSLDAAGISRVGPAAGDERDPGAPVLGVHYRGFGHDRLAFATGVLEPGSDLRRLVEVLHDYLPVGRRLVAMDLGDRQSRPALLRVPEPVDDAGAALAFHQELCRRYPEDIELSVDTFALAVEMGNAELAAELADSVARSVAEAGVQAPDNPVFATETPKLGEQLLAVVRAMQR